MRTLPAPGPRKRLRSAAWQRWGARRGPLWTWLPHLADPGMPGSSCSSRSAAVALSCAAVRPIKALMFADAKYAQFEASHV